MRRYTIVPDHDSESAFYIHAPDGGTVLSALSTKRLREADIWDGDSYRYSVRRNRKAGFWEIFQRQGLATSEVSSHG
jgi:hypothetical protein